MPTLPEVPGAGHLLAHPITESHSLAVPPLLAGLLAGLLVFSIALVLRQRDLPPRDLRPRDPEGRAVARGAPPLSRSLEEVASWAGRLTPAQVVVRCLAVAVLVLAVAAGRFGTDDELDNIAPALVVGLLWPLLVLASALGGGAWRWVDPWDTLGRFIGGGAEGRDGEPSAHVWPAVPVAGALVWYLGAYLDPLGPRSVGAALAVYTVFTTAGCLAFGRVRWLSSAEPIGLVLTWTALLPRRRLAGWQPPTGAEVLLGVVTGGLLFGLVHRSVLWGDLGAVSGPTLVATVGLVLSAGALAAFFLLMRRLARRTDGTPGVARAVVPALAGVCMAVALAQNRFTTSAQLLPGLAGDPFGLGWDLLGEPTSGLDAAPLGVTGLLVVQLVLLLAGCLIGTLVLARGLVPQSRPAAAFALSVLTATAVTVVATR